MQGLRELFSRLITSSRRRVPPSNDAVNGATAEDGIVCSHYVREGSGADKHGYRTHGLRTKTGGVFSQCRYHQSLRQRPGRRATALLLFLISHCPSCALALMDWNICRMCKYTRRNRTPNRLGCSGPSCTGSSSSNFNDCRIPKTPACVLIGGVERQHRYFEPWRH